MTEPAFNPQSIRTLDDDRVLYDHSYLLERSKMEFVQEEDDCELKDGRFIDDLFGPALDCSDERN